MTTNATGSDKALSFSILFTAVAFAAAAVLFVAGFGAASAPSESVAIAQQALGAWGFAGATVAAVVGIILVHVSSG